MTANRRLSGRTVVVTRSADQAGPLVERLRSLGAQTVELSTIEVVAPSDGGAGLRAAAARVDDYDWVVFTSANAAERFVALLGGGGMGSAKVAAIGPGTARALARWGVRADLLPDRFVAESLLEAFPSPPASGGRVLLPRAARARPVLPEGLAAAGWEVDVVEAYGIERPEPSAEALAAAATADAITFTSSSTVRGYLEMAGVGAVPPVVVCIGPVTAATARDHGIDVTVEADVHTVEGLVEALTTALQRPGS